MDEEEFKVRLNQLPRYSREFSIRSRYAGDPEGKLVEHGVRQKPNGTYVRYEHILALFGKKTIECHNGCYEPVHDNSGRVRRHRLLSFDELIWVNDEPFCCEGCAENYSRWGKGLEDNASILGEGCICKK